MKASVTQTGFAKVIWMGEHAVVYGHPALALPLKSASVEVTLDAHAQDYLSSPFYTGPIEHAPVMFTPIQTLFFLLKEHFESPPLAVTMTLNMPLAAGMGSSAAIAAALTRAFYVYFERPLELPVLYEWIQLSEALAHDKPSGVDATVITYEKPLSFMKGEASHFLHFTKKGYLLVVDSGVKGRTKDAVNKIRLHSHTEQTQHLIQTLGTLSETFIDTLPSSSLREMGGLMSQAHQVLKALGVSEPTLDKLCELALAHGALGAKLTGGGLGGCMLALVENETDLTALKNTFQNAGFSTLWTLDLERDFK